LAIVFLPQFNLVFLESEFFKKELLPYLSCVQATQPLKKGKINCLVEYSWLWNKMTVKAWLVLLEIQLLCLLSLLFSERLKEFVGFS
jgi:hypothetical protein